MKLMQVLSLLGNFMVKEEDDYELEIRPRRKEKTHQQRKLFHGLCLDAGKDLGYTPGQIKALVKEDYYGRDKITTPSGKTYEIVQSSEESDRIDYSALIEHLYRWSAENGILLPERSA